ncbi:hypothetical protein ACFLYD_08400 [Chloroflexota bacterium]
MRDDDIVQRLIWRETFAEVVAELTPEEVMVAWLRVQSLSDAEIGQRLGLDRERVEGKMLRARRRIAHRLPHLTPLLSGRRIRQGARGSPG